MVDRVGRVKARGATATDAFRRKNSGPNGGGRSRIDTINLTVKSMLRGLPSWYGDLISVPRSANGEVGPRRSVERLDGITCRSVFSCKEEHRLPGVKVAVRIAHARVSRPDESVSSEVCQRPIVISPFTPEERTGSNPATGPGEVKPFTNAGKARGGEAIVQGGRDGAR